MFLKTQAIVLHSVKFGDSSLVVKLFTREKGVLSFLVNGVRSQKPKFKSSFFLPLTLVDVIIYYKFNNQLQRIKEIKIETPYVDVHYNPNKIGICFFIQDFLNKILKYEVQNSELFDFLKLSLETFDSLKTGCTFFHIQFLLKLSPFLGYSFINEHGYDSINNEIYQLLYELNQKPYGFDSKITYSPKILLNQILKFYTKYFEQLLPLKSLDVLKELYN